MITQPRCISEFETRSYSGEYTQHITHTQHMYIKSWWNSFHSKALFLDGMVACVWQLLGLLGLECYGLFFKHPEGEEIDERRENQCACADMLTNGSIVSPVYNHMNYNTLAAPSLTVDKLESRLYLNKRA